MKVGPENSTNQNGGKVSTLSRPDSVIERLKIEDVDDQGNNGLTIGNCYVSGAYDNSYNIKENLNYRNKSNLCEFDHLRELQHNSFGDVLHFYCGRCDFSRHFLPTTGSKRRLGAI